MTDVPGACYLATNGFETRDASLCGLDSDALRILYCEVPTGVTLTIKTSRLLPA